MATTRLDKYNNSWYNAGGNPISRIAWYFINALVLNSALLPISGLKVALLRLFGAKIGQGVVIKPCVNIKYPWRLTIGNHVWIGEEVWIDNLDQVTIGDHVCLSQGAMLLCGSHNYKDHAFGLITKPITLESGCWISAKALVAPGVTCQSHSVLSASSVATADLAAFTIYQGNPAVPKRNREIN
jgi:putative colanic acid biosynthesis acetyltransferase WcaF